MIALGETFIVRGQLEASETGNHFAVLFKLRAMFILTRELSVSISN